MSNFGQGLSSLIPSGATPPQQPVKPVLPQHQADEGGVLRMLQVDPNQIDPNPSQPRNVFDPEKIQELQDSIATYGILEPLIVIQKPDGRFELIAGERRWRAAKNLGLPKVPVIVRHADDLERLELSLIENLQRQDLNPIEEAQGYQELINGFGLTQEQVAKKVGKSRETVSNLLRLLELSGEMQKAIASAKISGAHARILLSIDNPRHREEVFRKIIDKGLSVRETEALAAPQMRRRRASIKDPSMLVDETRLREHFNTKVQIEKRGQRGRVIIHFYSDEDYGELIGKLAGD